MTAPATAAEARALLARCVVLDVRDPGAFARGHLPGSGQLEPHEFAGRRPELPPRDAAILVVAEEPASAAAAAEALAALGFASVRWLEAPLDGFAADYISGPPAPLWRPNPYLAGILPRLGRGRAADLAAGSGRDAVYLALHGFEVDAWDSDTEALARAEALARRHGAALATVVCDLERSPSRIATARYDLVVCFRFLHRPLFAHIERALLPGGHLVYETYREGQQQFGRPRRPRFLLADGELRRAFPSLVVLDYQEPSPPGGPWTARLLARRPPG